MRCQQMKIKRVISLLLTLIILLGSFSQIPMTAVAANNTVRDTVLILDDSGSMEGEPMDKLIDSANKFCESVLGSTGTNRVAVITYSTVAELKCNFTNDMSTLKSAFNDMDEYGMTNIYDALTIANDLLSKSNANVKNIVLMSDGLPNEGSTSSSGKYTYSDYDGYDYANAVYNQAVSYHPNYYIYTLGFFHNIYGDTKAFAGRFMNDLQNAGYYEVDKVEDLEFTFGEIAEDIAETKVTGTFKYPNGAKDYSATYYYADEYFYDTSMNYNSSLATMSLCLAMSAFGSGEVSSYTNKSVNVKALMEELMFTDFETTKSFTEKPTSDSIAAAISQKRIRDKNGEVYTLLAVAVRGGGYEQEWASNFTIGQNDNHTGFSAAANQVINFIKNYITAHDIEGSIKLWVTGYSRAAATSNLVAGYLDQGTSLGSNVSLQKKDLFAYCFETPAGTTDTDANDTNKYGNIYNIINPNDLVTKVAPTAMGFRRYGIDRVLPTRENKYNSYSQDTEAMLKQYNALESTGEYKLNQFVYKRIDLSNFWPGGKEIIYEADEQMPMSAFLDETFNKLVYGYISRDKYYNDIENGIRELCKALFVDESKTSKVIEATMKKIEENIVWLVGEFIFNTKGSYGTLANYLVEALNEQGVKGFDSAQIKKAAEPLLGSLVDYIANNIDDLITIVDNSDYFFPAHYPELCLAWMQSMDVNYTTDAGEAFSSGSYRIIRINCPVNINVYDATGKLVATIADDKSQVIDNSSISSIINSDGEKIVYLPADAEFKIDITGTDNGLVSYSVNEYSHEAGQVNRLVNYYDVPIETGKSINAVVPAYDKNYLSNGTMNGTNTAYQLKDMNGNVLIPNLDTTGQEAINSYHTVTAKSDNEERGSVTGSGIQQTGSYAKVTAIAKEGHTFEGWYINDEKVSSDSEYRFCVKEDVTIIAKFSDSSAAATTTEKKFDINPWIIVAAVLAIFLIAGGIFLFILFGNKKATDNISDNNTAFVVPVKNSNEQENEKESKEYPITDDIARVSGVIQITNGSMNGFSVPIKDGEVLYLGKDPNVANIVFTSDYKNVSRVHCSVTFDAKTGKYYVTDCSSNGTYFISRKRLIKGKRTPVNINTVLLLANDECTILLN